MNPNRSELALAATTLGGAGQQTAAELLHRLAEGLPIRYETGANATTWLCMLDATDDAELELLQIMVSALAYADSQGADKATRLRVLRYLRDRTKAEATPAFSFLAPVQTRRGPNDLTAAGGWTAPADGVTPQHHTTPRDPA